LNLFEAVFWLVDAPSPDSLIERARDKYVLKLGVEGDTGGRVLEVEDLLWANFADPP